MAGTGKSKRRGQEVFSGFTRQQEASLVAADTARGSRKKYEARNNKGKKCQDNFMRRTEA